MNTKSSIPMVVLAVALAALAQQAQDQSVSQTPDPAAVMRADPYLRPPGLVTGSSASQSVPLGNSDYVISGPLVGGIYGPSAVIEQPAVWKRVVLLPVHILTPQPVAPPSEKGGYFQWNNLSPQPWTVVASKARVTTDDPVITDEPVG